MTRPTRSGALALGGLALLGLGLPTVVGAGIDVREPSEQVGPGLQVVPRHAEVKLVDVTGGKELRYKAFEDEKNEFTVSFSVSSGNLILRESQSLGNAPAPTDAGEGCANITTSQVKCPRRGVVSMKLELGGGNDRAVISQGITVSGGTEPIPASIKGEDGNDEILGGSGADGLEGGVGDDTLEGRGGRDKLRGGNNQDTLRGEDDNDNLDGGPGGDTMDGGANESEFRGDVADYGIRSTRNHVSLDDARNDGTDANNNGFGEEQDLITNVEGVRGGSGPDTIVGNGVINELSGGAGADTLFGLGGDQDSLDGGTGADDLHGGEGLNDAVVNANRNDRLRLSIGDGANDGADANNNGVAEEGDNIREDVENVAGGGGPDFILGDGDRNFLSGNAGNDRIDGAGGDDLLEGNNGDDRFLAGPGADSMTGDSVASAEGPPPPPFRDIVDYSGRSTSVKASIGNIPGASPDLNRDGEDANLDGLSEEGDFVGSDIEVLIGGNARDTLRAAEANSGAGEGATLFGGPENDTLVGDVRRDTLLGGAGADDLRGGGAEDAVSYSDVTSRVVVTLDNVRNDGVDANFDGVAEESDSVGQNGDVERVFGGSGNDDLTGNDGPNLLNGGPGQDRLRALGGADTVNANDGVADLEISCGAGVDSAVLDNADVAFLGVFPADCEGGSNTPKGKPSPLVVSSKTVTMTDDGTAVMSIYCPRHARGGRCKGRIEIDSLPAAAGAGALTSAGQAFELGSSRYELGARKHARIPVELSRAGRALVKARKDVRVEATATDDFRDAAGRRRDAITTLHLVRGD